MYFNYDELNRLKKRNTIGYLLIFTIIIVSFVGGEYLITISPISQLLKDYEIATFVYIVIIGVAVIIIYKKLCSPYNIYKKNLNNEVKTTVLKTELDNKFNGTVKPEDETQMRQTIEELGIVNRYRSLQINDCFSCKYKQIDFKYSDIRIYHSDDDGTVTDFRGPIIEFELNNSIEGIVYISIEVKVLIGTTSIVSHLIDNKKYNKIKPTNSVLNENIVIKSDVNPSIVENQAFQGAINELINSDPKYVFIIKGNKLYVLISSGIDSFEVNVRSQEEENNAKERIREEVESLRLEVEKIIGYKNAFGIKENTF